jgi:hypothetical protein
MELCPPFDGWHIDDVAKRGIFTDSLVKPGRPLCEANDWAVDLARLRRVGQHGVCTRCQQRHE